MDISNKINKHSAPGQALGYIFQFERALDWLSRIEPDSTVSIETDDDVVVSLNNGNKIEKLYEQDKSSISKKNPFSNQSIDLWKSLSTWAEGVNNGNFVLGKCKFILVTNKKIPKTSLICQLTNTKSEVEFIEIYKKVELILKKPPPRIAPFCDEILKLPESELVNLLKNIEVLDLNYLHDREEYKTKILRNLKMSKQISPNRVYGYLLGWLTDYVINCWINKKDATIKAEDLITHSNLIIAKFFTKPFIELAEESLPVTEAHRKEYIGDNFVKQLRWINIDDDVILNSIDDFLRAKWERIRYAEEGNIPGNLHFEEFEKELKEQWKSQFEIHSIDSETEDQHIKNGKRVFWTVISKRFKLAGYETEQFYTSKGGFQKLANKFEIGWHINWKKLKDK